MSEEPVETFRWFDVEPLEAHEILIGRADQPDERERAGIIVKATLGDGEVQWLLFSMDPDDPGTFMGCAPTYESAISSFVPLPGVGFMENWKRRRELSRETGIE